MSQTLQYYEKNAKEFADGTLHADMHELYAFFEQYCVTGGRVLDFGCGCGRDTKYFLQKGYAVDAVDGSEELCKIASAYTGLPVKHLLFQQLDAMECYDGIWACASILHVPKNDLHEVFLRLYRALKPNGYLYVSFKYGSFSGDRNGRFFTDLTKESFCELISRIPGFAVREMMVTEDVRPDQKQQKWLNVILHKIDSDTKR